MKLREAVDKYRAHRRENSTKNAYNTECSRTARLLEILGEGAVVESLTPKNLQRYIEKRAKDGVSPVTIRKEIELFAVIRHWLLCPPAIHRQLKYPT